MKLKYRVIERFRGTYSVEEMCRVFQVSRSGYYSWRVRQSKPSKDQWLIDLVVKCQQKCNQTYTVIFELGIPRSILFRKGLSPQTDTSALHQDTSHDQPQS